MCGLPLHHDQLWGTCTILFWHAPWLNCRFLLGLDVQHAPSDTRHWQACHISHEYLSHIYFLDHLQDILTERINQAHTINESVYMNLMNCNVNVARTVPDGSFTLHVTLDVHHIHVTVLMMVCPLKLQLSENIIHPGIHEIVDAIFPIIVMRKVTDILFYVTIDKEK